MLLVGSLAVRANRRMEKVRSRLLCTNVKSQGIRAFCFSVVPEVGEGYKTEARLAGFGRRRCWDGRCSQVSCYRFSRSREGHYNAGCGEEVENSPGRLLGLDAPRVPSLGGVPFAHATYNKSKVVLRLIAVIWTRWIM